MFDVQEAESVIKTTEAGNLKVWEKNRNGSRSILSDLDLYKRSLKKIRIYGLIPWFVFGVGPGVVSLSVLLRKLEPWGGRIFLGSLALLICVTLLYVYISGKQYHLMVRTNDLERDLTEKLKILRHFNLHYWSRSDSEQILLDLAEHKIWKEEEFAKIKQPNITESKRVLVAMEQCEARFNQAFDFLLPFEYFKEEERSSFFKKAANG